MCSIRPALEHISKPLDPLESNESPTLTRTTSIVVEKLSEAIFNEHEVVRRLSDRKKGA